jgi:hypothetical protein
MQLQSQKIRPIFCIVLFIIVTFFCQPNPVEGTPIVNTDKGIYNYGETIKVNFFDAPGYQRDWVCIVPAGSPDNEPGDYKHMPEGLKQGILIFDSPSPGKYEVRAYYNYNIFSGYVVSARHGFSVVAGGPRGKSERSAPTKEVSERPAPAKEVDNNFIPSPRLSNNNFNHLWTVATDKCNDFGWSIANNDKTKRDLMCQSQSINTTMTLRIKFTDNGMYIDVLMSSAEWASFGGAGMASRTKEYREMKKALQDALSEIQSSRKEIMDATPIVRQQISNEKSVEKPNGTHIIESKPASLKKSRKPVITEQAKTESSQQSMTTTQAQKHLSELGYQPDPSDGKIGRKTTEALKKFQQDNNLPVTGKVDNETVNKLHQKKAKDIKQQDIKPRTPKTEAPMKSEPVKARSPLDL